jgi:hypothetical protein
MPTDHSGGYPEEHRADIERTDEALAASRARHERPRDYETEKRVDDAMENERHNIQRGEKPRWPGDRHRGAGHVQEVSATRRLPLLAVLAVIALVGAGSYFAANLIGVDRQSSKTTATVSDLQQERIERTDQTCRVMESFENAQRDALTKERRRLRQTLKYIREIPPAERHTQLNQAVIRALPQVRGDVETARKLATAARAPHYCNAPSVGLPEHSEGQSAAPRDNAQERAHDASATVGQAEIVAALVDNYGADVLSRVRP